MLRIRDVYPGSEFFPSRILSQKDSRIPDPDYHQHQRIYVLFIKNFSRKYDPGCSSRIRIPDLNFLPITIPEPGVKTLDLRSATLRKSMYLLTCGGFKSAKRLGSANCKSANYKSAQSQKYWVRKIAKRRSATFEN